MEEIWKDIPEYGGRYQISDRGSLKTFSRRIKGRGYSYQIDRNWKGLEMTPNAHRDGYKKISLYQGEKIKTYFVHRLVLLTFKGNSDLVCNHKNGIKTDNRLENLEYCTHRENDSHAVKMGLRKPKKGEEHYNTSLTELQVKEILKMKTNIRYGDRTKLAKKYGVSLNVICGVLNGYHWKHITLSG